MKKFCWAIIPALFLIAFSQEANAQFSGCSFNTDTGQWEDANGGPCVNTIITAVPFLRIVPEARAGAMGDTGIATSPDANAMHFNASKLAFAEKPIGIAATYTPWLRSLGLNDVYMAYLSAYGKIGDESNQAVAGSIRYFSLGQINYTNNNGDAIGTGRPNEFEIATAYSRKLSDFFAVGLGMKFIYSNLAAGQSVDNVPIKPGITGAADLSFTFAKPIKVGQNDAKINAALAISNIGPKITYTNSTNRDYIPTNLGMGTALELNLDEFNSLTFALDLNKLMVPTPIIGMEDANGVFVDSEGNPIDANNNDQPDWKEKGLVSAMFGSFSDAPNGAGEEFSEFMISSGIEYWYDKQFAVRAGYYWEAPSKGNRQFFTVGLGLKYSIFGLDFSYLVPTSNQRNPLDNTLRFTLLFDFGAFGDDSGL